MFLQFISSLFGADQFREVKGPKPDEKTEEVSPRAVGTITSLKACAGKKRSIEILPDGLRICFLILVDEAKTNPVGLDALACALDFKISDLLRCFDENWLKG